MAVEGFKVEDKVVGDYVAVKQIGSGSFSIVWKGIHKETKEEVAIKEVPTSKLSGKLQESLESEISILANANHPNIVRLLDILKTPERIFLIMEFCAGGDLSSYIRKNGPVDEITAQHFMRQLGSGLQVLRANNLIHRDLKPQNLLLSERSPAASIKIADFGFARSLQPQGLAETLCGSPLYMAPEILQCQKYDAKADLWSVGAILFELVVGRPPFGGQNHVHLLQNIKKHEAVVPPEIASRLSEGCKNLIRCLLKRNPVERLSFEEFFNHSFLGLSSLSTHSQMPRTASDSKVPERPAVGPAVPFSQPSFASKVPVASVEPPFVAPDPRDAEATRAPAAGPSFGTPQAFVQPQVGASPRMPSGKGVVAHITPTHEPSGRARIADEGAGGAVAATSGNSSEGRSAPPTCAKSDSSNPPSTSAGGSALDSLEALEREYVVVDPPSGTVSPLCRASPSPSSSPGRALRKAVTYNAAGPLPPSADFRASPSPSPSPSPNHPLTGGIPEAAKSSSPSPQRHRSSPSPTSSPSRPKYKPGTVQEALVIPSTGESAVYPGPVPGLPSLSSAAKAFVPAPLTSVQPSGAGQSPRGYSPFAAPGLPPSVPQASGPGGPAPQGPALPAASHGVESVGIGQGSGRKVTGGLGPALAGSRPSGSGRLEAHVPGPAEDEVPQDRLARLSNCAHCVSDLSSSKLESGWPLEAFSLQLLVLVIWKEALGVCHSWAASSQEEEAAGQQPGGHLGYGDRVGGGGGVLDAARWCDTVESEYLLAVTRCEQIGDSVCKDDSAVIPDCAESVYQAALALGRAGAVEELMGRISAAESSYARALCLFQFLLWEAPRLPLSPPLAQLSPEEKQRLQRYSDNINARRLQCAQELDSAHSAQVA